MDTKNPTRLVIGNHFLNRSNITCKLHKSIPSKDIRMNEVAKDS